MVTAANMTKKSDAIFAVGEVLSATYYPTHDTAAESEISYPKCKFQRPKSANNNDGGGHRENMAGTWIIPPLKSGETPIDVKRGQCVVEGVRYQIKGLVQDSPLCRKYRVTHVDAVKQVTLKDKVSGAMAGAP